MTLSTRPLSYCSNVHPGLTVAEVETGLDQFTIPVQSRIGRPLAAGLWLAEPVIRELHASPDAIAKFAAGLAERDLTCYTLNAFPYGNFHSDRVKENVYLPDWSQSERLEYTVGCANVLSQILPENSEGSISTVPLGFKEFEYAEDFPNRAIDQLIELAKTLSKLHEQTGRLIRLAIEPEPFCLLETTDETVAFFQKLRAVAADRNVLELVNRHIGVCYDVCHQAVEFEDIAASIAKLADEDIRIVKVHITCAIDIPNPSANPDAIAALARFVEPRYLHQTMGRLSSGKVVRVVDLDSQFVESPPSEFANAETWRVHYHVPVNAESVGPLGTTRHVLPTALDAVNALPYAPDLEVETYTWDVLPGEQPDLVAGLSAELDATERLLTEIRER
ncbi:metabolite traffic protein EboE [Thalassoroseus pseudoceratinae]|uniref:metabolite traffic protein EboE n=1 Tax=Thalassoroseus pseudoceratinae TaxID=2713176 RepID=UPI001422FAD2|nr:metabolite traffic protein EboE [Thalassoroseus pseudoceratinae]